MLPLDRIKTFLEYVSEENLHFKQHFCDRISERPITEELVREYIRKTKRIINVEEQPAKNVNEEKYKIWIKLSNKYSLVLIITICEKDLYIITGWNTDRKWQKSIQK